MPKQNNIKKTCFALLLACSLTSAFAQGEPEKTEPEKLAVYVFGTRDAGINKSFGNSLLSAITQSGKYAEIGEQEAFYNELAKSHNDSISQIAQTAKQYGADFVCAVSMAEAFGEYSISARIIKTADSQIIRTSLLNRSLNSLDDLARVSDELAGQLLQSQSPVSVPPSAEASPNEPAPQAAPTAKKECKSIFNINELVFKIQSGLLDQLKDCSATLAKNIALSKSPFGKKTELKEPKAFMMECTIDGIKQKLPSGIDEYIKPVKSFVQNTLSAASAANGELDVAKLSKAIGDMNIGELLDEIRKLAGEDECMVDEPYEPPVAVGGKEEGGGSEGKGKAMQWGLRVSLLPLNSYGFLLDIARSEEFHSQHSLVLLCKSAACVIEILPFSLSGKFSAFRIHAGPYFGICMEGDSSVDVGINVGLGFDIWRFYIGAFYEGGFISAGHYTQGASLINLGVNFGL